MRAFQIFRTRSSLLVVIVFTLASLRLSAQTKSATPAFEVASIRLEDPHTPPGAFNFPGANGPTQYPANRITQRHIMLQSVISEAYGIDFNKILGGPDWLDHQHYDLTAKVEGDTLLTLEQMQPMLQNLLQERFHMKAHREQRIVPGYALIVAKGGPKLTPDKDAPSNWYFNTYEFKFHYQTPEQVAKNVGFAIKQPVVDHTGLTGTYDGDVKYAPQDTPTDPPYADRPSIFTAVQEQLGLKLVPQKVPVDYLVIDHVDKIPTEN
jgi:uncharacterized protein (TIGR03435 family)